MTKDEMDTRWEALAIFIIGIFIGIVCVYVGIGIEREANEATERMVQYENH